MLGIPMEMRRIAGGRESGDHETSEYNKILYLNNIYIYIYEYEYNITLV